MRISHCMNMGIRHVVRSPALVFWIYLVGLLLAVPLTAAMRDILKESIGGSLVHQELRQGFDLDWYGEFRHGSTGLAETFGPWLVGILPVLSNLERLLDGEILAMNRTVLLAGILFLLGWAFFAGGIITRYAKPEEPYTRSAFFSISAEYFFRFVRLLIVSLLLYWALFRWVSTPLHDWLERATRDVTSELTVMAYTVLVYLLVALILMIGNIILDYAKITMVVETRRSALLALIRGLRIVFANPGPTLGLYFSLMLLGLVLFMIYGLVAPGPGQSGNFTLIMTFLLSQFYLLARLILKLWFLSSQTVLFQSLMGERPVEDPPIPEAAAPVL